LPTKRVTGAQIVCGTTQLGFELKAAKKNQKIFLTLPTLKNDYLALRLLCALCVLRVNRDLRISFAALLLCDLKIFWLFQFSKSD